MKRIVISLIFLYQKVNKLLGTKRVCIFYPTCSEYIKKAVESRGVFMGIALGIKRVCRCNPWGSGGVDLVK